MSFAERIKGLRETAGFKQSEVADMLGIATSTVGNYERGKTEPPFALLKKMSHIYNSSIDYMLEETSVRARPKEAHILYRGEVSCIELGQLLCDLDNLTVHQMEVLLSILREMTENNKINLAVRPNGRK